MTREKANCAPKERTQRQSQAVSVGKGPCSDDVHVEVCSEGTPLFEGTGLGPTPHGASPGPSRMSLGV